MKKESTNRVKLGIFIITVMILLVVGIYYIGQQQQLFSKTFHISGIFRDVSGLQAGNNIRFSGITVGTIENVEIITDTSVRVDMIVDESVRKFIKKDARATIGSDGLMGNKILNIAPGTIGQAEIQDHDFITTVQPVNMDEVLNKVKLTTDNAAEIANDLSDIMHNIHEGKGTIGKLFMDTVFAENLDQTIVNVKQGSKGFKQNMDAAKSSILLRGYFKKKESDKKETKDKK
jgi:phospholipid/cholesterol/gamma-HCH transport system substrate-binding protein